MLKLSGLTTHYGSSQALFGVDLEFGTGEVATLLGRNGMGKTTTINSIMGIVKASGGVQWAICFQVASSRCWQSGGR